MGRKKIEIKYIQDRLTRQITASKRRVGMFRKADALAKLCNVEVAVLLISSNERPYVFGSPCFNSLVRRFKNPNLSSPFQTRLLESRAKLDELKEELKQQKEREEVLKKKQEETLEIFDLKNLVDLTLEGFVAFKEKLEEVRDDMKRKPVEMEVSSCLLMLSQNKQ